MAAGGDAAREPDVNHSGERLSAAVLFSAYQERRPQAAVLIVPDVEAGDKILPVMVMASSLMENSPLRTAGGVVKITASEPPH